MPFINPNFNQDPSSVPQAAPRGGDTVQPAGAQASLNNMPGMRTSTGGTVGASASQMQNGTGGANPGLPQGVDPYTMALAKRQGQGSNANPVNDGAAQYSAMRSQQASEQQQQQQQATQQSRMIQSYRNQGQPQQNQSRAVYGMSSGSYKQMAVPQKPNPAFHPPAPAPAAPAPQAPQVPQAPRQTGGISLDVRDRGY